MLDNCPKPALRALNILVDAHVHIYKCYDLERLLNSALANFSKAAQDAGLPSGEVMMVLMLSESNKDNWFDNTIAECRKSPYVVRGESNWRIFKTSDPLVLKAVNSSRNANDESQILIVAGRQIVTAEGLELLALATDSHFSDGESILTTLVRVKASDAVPILPWAVGKWLGKRGKLVTKLISDSAQSGLSLGDNSGRPFFWTNPVHFRQARAKNMKLFRGSDPLPFSNEASRVGRFGFIVSGELSKQNFSTDLKDILLDDSQDLINYGELESCFRFFSNQIHLRLN